MIPLKINIEKIEALLAERKYEEVREILSDFFSQDMTIEEKASLYLDYASLYLKIMNKISSKYNASLRQIKKNLEEVAIFEKKFGERSHLAEVRSSL